MKKRKGYAEGGAVEDAETYNGGSGVSRRDMTGKRIVKVGEKDVKMYKNGGKVKRNAK